MKRNLILLSSTLFIASAAALAVETKTGTSAASKSSATTSSSKVTTTTAGGSKVTTITTTKTAVVTPRARKGTLPAPPKETLPGNTTMIMPTRTKATTTEVVQSSTDSGLVTVGEGGPFTAKTDKVQRFAEYVELKKGMESAPLTLTIHNNGFKWFRVLIANQVVATEKSQGRDGCAKLDVTGVIQSGSNQVVVQAGGMPGASLDWKVTTLAQAKLERVDPDEALVGDTVVVKGQHFATTAAGNEITIGGKSGKIIQSKATELKVSIPTNVEPGVADVIAKVNGVKTNTIKMKVRGIPSVSGASLQGVPPGQTLSVFGKNFSKNLGENRVFFDDTSAEIVSGSSTELVVVAPFVPYREGHNPSQVRVQVGKIMSKNATQVTVGPQMFTDPGVETGRGIPEYTAR